MSSNTARYLITVKSWQSEVEEANVRPKLLERSPVRSACGSDASRRSRPDSMTNQVVMRTALGPRNMIVSRHSMVC
jgi:hypothetical protein